MRSTLRPFHAAFLILLVATVAPVQAGAAESDAVITDFETGTGTALRLNAATATVTTGDAAQGKRFMKLRPGTDAPGRAYVRLELPPDVQFHAHDRLTVQLRAPESKQQIKLYWFALNQHNQPLFVRTFELPPGEQWIKLEAPLRTWRWDVGRIGDWDEVAAVALQIGSPNVAQVDIDDIRLEGAADPDAHVNWLLDLAFGAGAARKAASQDGLLVATDAVEAFSDDDLRRLLDDMIRTRAFIRRVFGDAVRPTDELGSPAMLIIFADNAQRRRFFEQLGAEWRATIEISQSQGFTIQDIATATYDPKLGVRRPVYLHESAHAVVARDLRLLTGHAPHTPLQEGLATYLQICVHPGSIDRGAYSRAFAQPIDPAGKGFFKPLEQLFGERATTDRYAQLASVVAYLVENDQQLLRDLVAGLAEGSSASDILARRGPTWGELEEAWLAWGRENFKRHDDDVIFTCPAEFQ